MGGPPCPRLTPGPRGPRVRATLALYFFGGALLSLTVLGLAGHLPVRQVVAGLALLPFVLAGFLLAGPLRRYLDAGRLRLALLIVVGTSAMVLIVRNLI
jgi:hypothetical protein